MRALKGHGTENDFVVIPDFDGTLQLTPAMVRALCDRHAGIGADGVLRVVRADNDPDGKPMSAEAEYFMDYRNADGSVAEMCGNGVRVFVRFLESQGLATGEIPVATRAGVRHTQTGDDGSITVDMGVPSLPARRPRVDGAEGVAVEMPNPHVVVTLDSVDGLTGLDLSRTPAVDPARADGQNVEFVVRLGEQHLRMRVHERGVGETRSCGTGICAVVAAIGRPDGSSWRVDVPGGTCTVTWFPNGHMLLTGPAVLVAELEVDEQALHAG